jgi:hypothetical protein
MSVSRGVVDLAALALASSCGSRGDVAAPPEPTATQGARVAPSKVAPEPRSPVVEVAGLDALVHKPLLALVERDPWLDVVGSGRAVVRPLRGRARHLRTAGAGPSGRRQKTARLSREAALAIARGVVDDSLAGWPAWTACTNGSDQPTTTLLAREGTRWRRVSVYGMGRAMPELGAPTPPPAGFERMHARLRAFDAPDAEAWRPEQLEIMLGVFDHAPGAATWSSEVGTAARKAQQEHGSLRRRTRGGQGCFGSTTGTLPTRPEQQAPSSSVMCAVASSTAPLLRWRVMAQSPSLSAMRSIDDPTNEASHELTPASHDPSPTTSQAELVVTVATSFAVRPPPNSSENSPRKQS